MRVTFVDASLFLYVFGAFVVSKIEEITILTNLFLIVLLLALVSGKHNAPRKLSWLQAFPLAISALALASLLWSYDMKVALEFSISFSSAIVGGAAVGLGLANGANPKVLKLAASVGSAILVVSAWRELITLHLGRVAGITGNANDLGISITIAALLIINPLQKSSPITKAIGLSFVAFAVLTTGSRKMLIVIAIFLLYYAYFLFAGSNRSKSKVLRIFLLMMFGVVFLAFFGQYLIRLFQETEICKRTLSTLQGTESSADKRVLMIDYGIYLWKQRPFIGYGINQYQFHGMWNTYSHNNYVEMLINLGIVGLIIYYFVHIKILIDAGKHLSGKSRWFVLCMLLLLLLWDVAFVSYRSKLVWVLIASLVWTVGSGRKSNSLSENR